MAISKEDCIEEIVSALDTLKHIDKEVKSRFAKQILEKIPKIRQTVKNAPVAKEYSRNLSDAASEAAKALRDYFNIRYKPPETMGVAIRQSLIATIDKEELEKFITKLDIIRELYNKKRKSGSDPTEEFLIANMVAYFYKKILGEKPEHNSHFTPHNYKNWDSNFGMPKAFDMVCYIIQRYINKKHTEIKFSEDILRQAADRQSEVK